MSFRHSLPLLLGRTTARISPKFDAVFWRYLRLGKPQPLWRLEGLSYAGEPASMISGGSDPKGEYLPSCFFSGEYRSESLGKIPLHKFRRFLDEQKLRADFTAVRMDRVIARMFFRTGYLQVPEWVRSSIKVPENVESLALGHNSLRQDMRLIRKHKFTAVESFLPADFEIFFNDFYQPHGLGRHGPHAHLRAKALAKGSFERGVLLWICQEDKKVAGLLVEKKGRGAIFSAIGVRQGDESLMKIGALSATYYFGLQYAQRINCAKIDLGGTRPSPENGLFRYKRKWGAVVENRPMHVNEHAVYWPSANAGVMAMLKKTPLIFRDHGKMSGLFIPSEPPVDPSSAPGLHRFLSIQPGSSLPRITL